MIDLQDKRWLTIKAAASYLGTSTDFVRDVIADGEIHYYKLRHTLFIEREELDQLILQNKQ